VRARHLDSRRCPPCRAARAGARLGGRQRAARLAAPRAARGGARDLRARSASPRHQLDALAGESPLITRLRTIPGVGLLTATALAASLGDVQRFPSARHLASALGLTPRESASGHVRRLGRISKKGDPCLRMLLIHGARTTLLHAKRAKQPIDFAPGRSNGSAPAATTRPRSPWRTSWRGSSGRCGATGAPTAPSRRRPNLDPTSDDAMSE